MWAHYLGLWFLFLFFFALTIAIYYYAKWQIKGPIIKMKWKKFKSWIKMENKSQIKVKNGEVNIDKRILDEIERTKSEANAAQDFLKVQNLEIDLAKKKEEAMKDYESKSRKGLFKKKDRTETINVEDNQHKSILDELGEGNSAQDLLHRQTTTNIASTNVEEGKSILEDWNNEKK